jgi:vesicle-fusing ATPase
MTAIAAGGHASANQAWLASALGDLGALIRRPGGGEPLVRAAADPASSLNQVVEIFALTEFERDILLLCAGVELDDAFAQTCRNAARGEVTFGFALATLPGAHWSALAPTSPLRYWRLIEMRAGETLTTSPLRIDERLLHHLAGVSHLDERLHGVIRRHRPTGDLPRGQRQVVDRIAALWARPGVRGAEWPAVQLIGEEDAGAADVASAACASQGLGLCVMQAADLPQGGADRALFDRLWAREAALSAAGLLIETSSVDGPETLRAVSAFAARARSAILIASREPLPAPGVAVARFDIPKPSRAEQAALWRAALRRGTRCPGLAQAGSEAPDDPALTDAVDALTAHFDFGAATIAAASEIVLGEGGGDGDRRALAERLWETSRTQARGRMDDLAQRIVPAASWDDLVLPAEQTEVLREIVACVRQRAIVYEQWGFAAKGSRGLGVSALFSGPSGTGKTLAAEILAHTLNLDLYRIDLSQVVSKYIGETEKNLNRVFGAAEAAGAVLLFDEADALFGKRSEVKDSHDRYANMEVSYLLQRMEQYRGLAILTTNQQQALDPAFRRRLRFIVSFPFPEEAERRAIWARVFPAATPLEGVDPARLARLNVTGGNIRNIALGAAFLAADDGGPVTMAHLLRTARAECGKLGRPLTDAEVGGWI